MTDRVTRLKSIMLSPGLSIIVGLPFLGLLLLSDWTVILPTLGVCLLMVYNIKARILFKGPNSPFATLFVALQAATAATLDGSILAFVMALILTIMLFCFSRPKETKTYFLIFLSLGLGALWFRSFLLLSGVVMILMILLRSFSMRGFVAAMLGLLTPLICLMSFWLLDVLTLIENYIEPFRVGINPDWIFASVIAIFYGIIMFLPSYGYPAKARARNMAILGLTGCAIILGCIDFRHVTEYIPLINLCAAYHAGHSAAQYRFGWIGELLVIAACTLFICYTAV